MTKARPKVVGDLMTREVITLGEDDNLVKVEAGMKRFRFRHLPVVHDGKLTGLITHEELLHAMSSSLSSERHERDHLIEERGLAKMVMQKDVATISADASLADAASLMWENKVGCLPVVEEDGTLVGIITEADYMRLCVELLGDEDDDIPVDDDAG